MIIVQGESQMITVQLKKNNIAADLSAGASVKNIVAKLSVSTDSGNEVEVCRYSLTNPPANHGVLNISGTDSIIFEAEAFQTKSFPVGTLIAYVEVTKNNVAFDLTQESKEQFVSTIGRVNKALAVL